MTAEEVRQVKAAVATWPHDDQAWWRELLEIAPDEALKIGTLVLLLDVRPHRPL